MLARPSLMEAPRSDMRIEEMSQLMLRSTPGRRPTRGHVGRRAAQVASALMFMQVRFSGFRALCRRSGAIAEEGEEVYGTCAGRTPWVSTGSVSRTGGPPGPAR